MKTIESGVSILQLNEYCLQFILEYLELKDHLSFAETCSQFRIVVKHWASRFYNSFVLVSDISIYEFKMLSLVNENLQMLCVDVNDLMDSLNEHYGKKRNYYFKQFCELFVGMQQLQSLKISQFKNSDRRYTNNLIRVAGNLQTLQQLEICAIKCKRPELRPFKQLKSLILDVNLSSIELRKSCHSMTNLRELHLSERVETSNLQNVIQKTPQLEQLSFCPTTKGKSLYCIQKQEHRPIQIFHYLANRPIGLVSLNVKGEIWDTNEVKQLASISSLKILACRFRDPHCVPLLRQLSNLEELRISFVTSTDISEVYLDLIRTLTKLRLLRIFDLNINESFAIKVSRVLEEFPDRQPLELFIFGHRDSAIGRTLRHIDSSHLIYTGMNVRELIKML